MEELRKALPAASKKGGLDLSPSQLAALVAGMDLVGKRSVNVRELQVPLLCGLKNVFFLIQKMRT